MAFDEALGIAKKALDDAVKAVEMAKELADAAATAEEREKAREALSDAQGGLADALKAARELPVPPGDTDSRGQADDLVSRAEAAQRAQNERIEEAQDSTQWSAWESLVRFPVSAALPEVRAERRIRTNTAGNAASENLLDADSFPAVLYEPGKVLISEGEASSGDELQLQGYAALWMDNQNKELRTSNFFRPLTDVDQVVVAGLRVTPAGLVVRMGGRGAGGIDFRRTYAGRPSSLDLRTDPLDVHGWDLTLAFGEPTSSPEGNGENYWAARLMPDPSQIADGAPDDTKDKLLADGRPSPVGTYALWLSNHAGVETNLEPVDGGSYPEDDDNSFLNYAAYGMMTFEASDEFPYEWSRLDRVHGFHLGYDAFADESGRRTTNIGEAVSSGKFTGLAIGLELDRISRGNLAAWTAIDLRLAKRLRGDVELKATISGTASDNSIKGWIRNLEVWDSRGYWKDYASIADDIELGSASIGANGGYRGTITGVAGFGDGQYVGSFYGPVSGLETAGAWFLNGTNSGADAVLKAIVGSFGAKHAPPAE